jgi:hypothetical protein
VVRRLLNTGGIIENHRGQTTIRLARCTTFGLVAAVVGALLAIDCRLPAGARPFDRERLVADR